MRRSAWALLLAAGLITQATVAVASVFDAGDVGPGPASAAAAGVVSEGRFVEGGAVHSGRVDPERYQMGPGDRLMVLVAGPVSRSSVIEVGPEGTVVLPDIGSVPVSGLTLAQARARIVERLRGQLRGVRIEVLLQSVRRFRVYLAGQVTRPGPLEAYGGARLGDVLADSLLLPTASRRNLLVRHLDGSESVFDLLRFQLLGEDDDSPLLADGDVVLVPSATRFIGAWGAFGRAGRFELGPHDSLRTLIRLAGGLRPEAQTDRCLLQRWVAGTARESLWVRLAPLPEGASDLPLRDGDHLYVSGLPEYNAIQQVSIVGRVRREGFQPIRLGVTRISDVVEAAGGFLDDADLSSVRLVRARGRAAADPEFERLSRLSRVEMTTSEYESFRTRLAALTPDFRVDWTQLKRHDPILDPLLEIDDVIRVERVANSVRVDGLVRSPGLITWRPGASWRWYVDQAGGFAGRAARSQVRVTRAANGQTVLARTVSEPLPGDFVWVPERPDVSTWSQLKDVLTIAAQVATVWIAFRR